jgi:hypothetical protein
MYLSSALIEKPSDQDVGFRLGREAMIVLNSGLSKCAETEESIRTGAEYLRSESWDEALIRQGY